MLILICFSTRASMCGHPIGRPGPCHFHFFFMSSQLDNGANGTTNNNDDIDSDNTFKMCNVNVDISDLNVNFSWKRLFAFIGPGFLVSVGYLDPGNWATDIEGGSKFGYKLIWVLLVCM